MTTVQEALGRLGNQNLSAPSTRAMEIQSDFTIIRAHIAEQDALLAACREERDALVKDAARLDMLELLVDEAGGLLLHNGLPNYHGFSGLGLKCTNRSLRQAIDDTVRYIRISTEEIK